MKDHSSELDRIRTEYNRRDGGGDKKTYDPLSPAYIYVRQEIERHLAVLLRKHVSKSGTSEGLAGMKLLDVGAGSGAFLEMFAQLGFKRRDIFGVDLMPGRLFDARENFTAENIACCDAAFLPFAESSFDVVSQFTVFSSVLSDEMKRRIASEMTRVTKPGGHVVWYDMIVTNPMNKNLRGIGYREIERLFGTRPTAVKRIVLNPWILRPLLKASRTLCDCLAFFGLLNSFYLVLARIEK